ncbi:hypothetical protein [Coprococcus sp. HCN-4056]|uniref:hypothetical protein n=1 Tax=Coprococcus sp. HCN-4056 TaxID=3134671 RepID=UPI0030C0FDE7
MSKKKDAKLKDKIKRLEAEVNIQKELIDVMTDALALAIIKVDKLEKEVYSK